MSNDPFSNLNENQKQLLEQASQHASKLVVIGALLVVCGTIGLLAEVAFSFASITILSIVAIIGGVLMGLHAFQARVWKTFLIQSLFAALYIGLGIFIWVAPVAALQGLTIWLAALFLVTGVMRLIAAFQNWSLGNGMWSAISGGLSIILGILILNNWPEASLWVPGMLLAIELLLQGWALIALGSALKRNGNAPDSK